MEVNRARTNKRPHSRDNDGVSGKRIKAEAVDNGSGGKVPTTCVQMFQDVDVNQTLRQAVSTWFERYTKITGLNAELCLTDLAKLQDMGDGDWRKHVLSLREVQKRITWVVQASKDVSNRKKRETISTTLRKILHPEHEIATKMFPNIREITESISSKSSFVDSVKLKKIVHLPDMLQESLSSIPNKAEQLVSYLRYAQWKLEATIRAYSQGVDNIYHYLVCVGVLRLFGLKVSGFFFERDLSKNDFENVVEMLGRHLDTFDSLHGKLQHQAYVVALVLCCPQDRDIFVQFVLDKLPEELCPELNAISDRNSFKEIGNTIDQLLPKEKDHSKVNWQSLLLCLKNQLRFICEFDEKVDTEPRGIGERLSDSVESVLRSLNMKKYYPQKLTYDDVIRLTSDVYAKGNAKPTTLPELAWYFMKHIIALDSETRENCHVPRSRHDYSGSSSDTEDETMADIHPLDLIYIIFLCADDFLRQELADKMTKCQYAVPFILPPKEYQNIKSKNLILHWALKTITRNFYHNDNVANQALIDVKGPVVVCMHSGGESAWKSRIVNKLLSPQQETFWHRGLKGGDCSQLCSNGMVEVAWYLPGRQQNTFSHPVTFLNLRMDIEPSDVVCDKLYEFSSLCCVFAAEIDDEIKEFLRNKTVLSKVVLIILHREGEDKEVRHTCKELAATFGLQKHQIIRKTADDVNFNVVLEQLQNHIEQSANTGGYSLSALASSVGSTLEVDDKKCYFAKMAAASILMDVDAFYAKDATSAKSKILPCQSDIKLRQKMSELDKELCRQRRRDENIRVQEYGLGIKEQKWQLQLRQLQVSISETFKYFLNCLQRSCPLERKYFLQCLKLGLNERSEQMLRPLYEEYERCRVKEGTDKDGKLREINESIMHGSLGIEHFFREMAVLYENMVALKVKSGSDQLNDILKTLAKSMARTIKEGMAIEIMDGDAVHVPVEWLKAVLADIEDESTLFKVSVLGAQSCGKSTLLNTVFGLNFPVSSGRCTRGAYMHLVKVDKSFEGELHCSYVAVIDSEGLMSRTKTDDTDYDNELSTFIIGLSDLTLVIIKGEGNEMNDVLPLAIHVFLRMNIVGEQQACKFVHQNMGAVDAMTKVATEIDAFVGELNEKTLAAAKDADQSDRYTKFTDVLHYDPLKDNTYVPGLWTGAPPMGRASSHYSKTLQKLKTEIIQSIANPAVFRHKKFCTFVQLSDRLAELWQAIKYENFVLSFKNVLAVEAHKKLTKIFSDEHWIAKRGIDDMTKQEKHIIENEIKVNHSNKPVKLLVENAVNKIHSSIVAKVGVIEEKILHYFRCHGCTKCSSSVTNRHLLANNEKEFRDEVQSLKRSLNKELNSCMEKFEKQMMAEKQIHELSIEMDTKLKGKVNEAIRSGKSEKWTQGELEEMFDRIWQEAARDILRSVKEVDQEEDIQAMVQSTIRSFLGSDDHYYMQIVTDSNKGVARNRAGKVAFKVVPEKHMRLIMRRWQDYKDKVTEDDVQRLQKITDSIIDDTKRHYENNSPAGRQFHQRYVEELFVDVLDQIVKIKDERFKTAFFYKVDVLHHIEIMAVGGFTEMHDSYVKQSSREAILAEKKNSYRDMFILNMGYDNVAVSFCETVLKEIILRNVEVQLSCTDLLHDLRTTSNDMFRDIKSIQAAIMVDIFREQKFSYFLEYIRDYKACVKRKMEKECLQYFVNDKKYRELAQKALDRVINNILQAIDSTAQTNCNTKTFLRTFFSKIEYLKIPPHEISGYLDQDILDKRQFKKNVHQQLNGRLRDAVKKKINTWNPKTKLKQMKLTDFLFTEIVGCNFTCPFCAVSCDAHTGGKTQGNHSATLHRPGGLYGYRWIDTGKLSTGDCRLHVVTDYHFIHGNPEKSTPYKDYQTIFPEWTIRGEADPDMEKYWKWVLAKYSEEFAKYYTAQEAEVPAEWGKYERDDIIKDIEDHYNIKVDRSKLNRPWRRW